MSILAKVAYLTALIFQSQQRVVIYQTNLLAADTAQDNVTTQDRLESEQAHQCDLVTERAGYQS